LAFCFVSRLICFSFNFFTSFCLPHFSSFLCSGKYVSFTYYIVKIFSTSH
jgi:hypothetical protein